MDAAIGLHRMRGLSRRVWSGRIGLGILLFLVSYGMVALEAGRKSRQASTRRTTYGASTGGYKILYLWLQRQGLPVQRWEKSLNKLPSHASVLLIAEPELGPGTGELKSLQRWVKKGNTLVLIGSGPNIFFDHFQIKGRGIRLQDKDTDDSVVLRFQPGPYTKDIHDLQTGYHFDLSSNRPEVITHIRDPRGAILVVAREGKGRVIGLADPKLLSNGLLREADHARLAANLLLTHRGKGLVLFDEFHHGYGRAASVMTHLLQSQVFHPIIQGLLALFVLWSALGRRFGPPRPRIQRETRSSLAYMRAMGLILQRARARGLALSSALQWIEEETRRLMIKIDGPLENALQLARARLAQGDIGDQELLDHTRNLYTALEAARKRVPGESVFQN